MAAAFPERIAVASPCIVRAVWSFTVAPALSAASTTGPSA